MFPVFLHQYLIKAVLQHETDPLKSTSQRTSFLKVQVQVQPCFCNFQYPIINFISAKLTNQVWNLSLGFLRAWPCWATALRGSFSFYFGENKQVPEHNKKHVFVWVAALPLYLLHEDKERLTIVLPLLRQLALMREFVTTHIHRQFKAVGVQIAEIIHTCQQRHIYLWASVNLVWVIILSTYWTDVVLIIKSGKTHLKSYMMLQDKT